MADDTNKSEVEILNAQLQIAEAKIIEHKATIAGLQAANTEIIALIKDNSTAQTVLSNAAAAISSEISALKEARRAEIDSLIEKADRCKKYVRGDI